MKIFGLGSVLHGDVCTGFISVKTNKTKSYSVKFSSGAILSLQEVEEMVLDNLE